VSLELLDPLDNLEATGNTVYDETGNIQIKGGSGQSSLWYAEVDEELQQEWNALVGTANNETNQVENVKVQVSGGKVINKESLHGVRVGSAGGWSLEVFPGDFVVHRYAFFRVSQQGMGSNYFCYKMSHLDLHPAQNHCFHLQ